MTDIRPIDTSPEGLERTKRLLNAVWPHATFIDVGYLDRLYNGNPRGPTSGFAAYGDDGELVAHYLMVPILAWVDGHQERGIWPFQFATHPGYRGKGLFSAMTAACHDEARDSGYGYLTGVGNDQSSPILERRGYQAVCQLQARIGVGPVPPPSGEENRTFSRIWDRDALAWRLGIAAEPYHVRRRDGLVHLYAPTGRAGIWAEIGCFDEDLLPEGLPELRPPHPVRLWLGVDPDRDWSRSLYVNIPRRFRPSPLTVLWKDLTGRDRRLDPARIRFEVVDFDAY